MSYVVDVGYALDLSQIGAAINKFKELQKEVGKTDKALNSMGKSAGSSSEAKRTKEMKDLSSAAEGASKKVKQVGDSAAQAGDKFDKLIEKNQLVRQYMVDGFTKGEAKILATAKQAGILESQFSSLQHTLLQVAKLSSDPFDNSRGSIRALEKDITSLRDRMELSAKGIYANTNQMRLFGRAAEEVRGEIEKLGIKLDSPAGQAEYNKRLGERREKLTALIRETNNLNEVERQAQRIAKENQRILERTASVERRVSVRQTSKEFGVNLQDASFILDAKATGNMQLYNKALESTRKTMLETIPVATTLKTLIPAIGAVGGVAFLAQATREFLKMADSMRLVEARINLVSTAGADASQVLDQLVEISKENRVNLDTTSRLYTRLVPAMESFKVNLEGATSATDAALKVTKAFGASLLISGANTQEAIAATTQFTQAMASGKLAGDEFRSVSEAAPAFLKAIADGSGYARSELKQLSSEGKLTTELLSQALIKMLDSLQAKADKVPVTMGQAFERVKTDLMVFSKELNESTGAVDFIVDTIETLSVVIQGAGEVLGFLRSVVDEINGPLNTLGTSFGQVVLAIGAVISISKLLTGIMGAAGIAGAASTAGTALSAVVVGMRGYVAATAISVAATGVMSTALVAARGAVLALGTAFLSTGIGAILAVAATAAGVLYFNSEQAALRLATLNEQKEASAKTSNVLLRSEEKLAASWDKLVKKAPGVAQAIEQSFASSGVKFLTDDQQRELEESMSRIQKLREKIVSGELKSKERAETEALVAVLKKEYDVRYQTFAQQQKIDMFNAATDGAASDMIKRLQDEVKQREQVNKLLREGVSLRRAEMIVAGMAAIQTQYADPEMQQGEGVLQYEARRYSIQRKRAEEEARLLGLIDQRNTLDEEQAAILDSQKKSKKEKTNSLLEELKSLEKLLPLAKQIGDVEKARLIAGGISAEQAQRLLDLRKQIQVLENAKSRKEETELVQKELELLKQGLTVEQTKAVLEQDALKRAMIAKGYSVTQFEDRVKDLALIKELTEADKERQEAVQKLQETYAEFIAPEKLEIGDLFGDAAQGAGVLLNTMYDIAAQQEEIAKRKELINKSGLKGQALEKELMAIQKKQSANELSNMRAVAGGAKQLFKEKSTAYKVLERLEQAMFIMQLYNQKAEIAAFVTGVATKVAGYATTALAAGKAAIASALIAPPPANFASLAAVLAVLAGVGIAISGSRSSGSDSAHIYNEGKGTVLGDSSAKSESISKSIEALEKYARVELPITSAMLQSLRNIESGIGGLGSLIARSPSGTPGSSLVAGVDVKTELTSMSNAVMTAGKVVGALNTIGVLSEISSIVSLFTSASGVGALVTIASALIPSVGKAVDKVIGTVVGGIFGKVSTKVVGQGVTANLQTMKQIFEEGFKLLDFVDIETKKKSWFGSSSKISTITKASDPELSNQFGMIFKNFYTSLQVAAEPLGQNLEAVTKNLDLFVVDIGKIRLGSNAKKNQERLEAVFGQQADLMARFAFANIGEEIFIQARTVKDAGTTFKKNVRYTMEEFLALPEAVQNAVKPLQGKKGQPKIDTAFDDFQKVGEGFFETVTRVASSIERAKLSANNLGVSLIELADVANKQGDVAVELLRQSLINAEVATYGFETGVSQMFSVFSGGIDDLDDMVESIRSMRDQMYATGKSVEYLTSAMASGAKGFDKLAEGLSSYFDDFLTEEEKAAEYMRQTARSFSSLNLTVPKTVDEFKQLVKGIDVTTEAGQRLYGSVIALAPAFKNMLSSIEEAVEAQIQAQEKLLEASKKSLDDAEKALKDAFNRESGEIQKVIDEFSKVIDGLRKFREDLNRGPQALLSPKAQLDADKKRFDDIAKKALSGDKDALGALEAVAKDYLGASEKYYASSGDYFKDLETVKSIVDQALSTAEKQKSNAELQLEEMKKQVGALIDLNESVLSVKDAIIAFKKAQIEYNKVAGGLQLDASGAIDALQVRLKLIGENLIRAMVDRNPAQVSSLLGGFFKDLDKTLDGMLSFDELQKALDGKATDNQIKALIVMLDTNLDGLISETEAQSAAVKTNSQLLTQGIGNIVEKIGKPVDYEQVKQALGPLADEAKLKKLFSSIDINADGLIDSEEIKNAINNTTSAVKEVEKAIREQSAKISGSVTESLESAGKNINFDEFKRAVQSSAGKAGVSSSLVTDAWVKDLFNSLNTNKDKFITQGGKNNEYSQAAVENALIGLLGGGSSGGVNNGGGSNSTEKPKPVVDTALKSADKAIVDTLSKMDSALVQLKTQLNNARKSLADANSEVDRIKALAKNPSSPGGKNVNAAEQKSINEANKLVTSAKSSVKSLEKEHTKQYDTIQAYKKKNASAISRYSKGQYYTGGYTGAGGVLEPAGMVHKGEVVFSQSDIKRWGGWQAVEMLRLMGPSGVMEDSANASVFSNQSIKVSHQGSASTVDNTPIVFAINEASRHTAALVTLQQAANRKIIDKLSEMEERLGGIESKARLEAAR